MRDFQKNKLYEWEKTHILPLDKTTVSFEFIQGMVDAIWAEMGLKFPPRVTHLHGNDRAYARGSRTNLYFRETARSWTILHELAHALASDVDENTNGHGPLFVGLYVQLLEKYLRIPRETMVSTLKDSGIVVNLNATPVFL